MHARGPFASAQRSVRLAAALAVALGTSGPGQAQIVRDGTVGPAGPLAGPNYTIPHTDGTRAGTNLFHSFRTFNLQTNESATFTGPEDIRHVLSRVTGGTRSDIDGTLKSAVGKADVWFINPAGVMFGPNAKIDVPASFHVSTADEVRFADGARFSAIDPAASTLTVAPPEAFGFLREDPAPLALDHSTLEVPDQATLSLVSGNITMTGGSITARSGRVNVASVASKGQVSISSSRDNGRSRDPDVATISRLGNIRLSEGAEISASARYSSTEDIPGGGTVAIRGGRLVVEGSSISSNTGDRDGAPNGIDVQVSNDLVLRSRSFGRVYYPASMTTDIYDWGTGNAGNIQVTADTVEITGDARLGSSGMTQSTGNSGHISVSARNVRISGSRNIRIHEPAVIDSSTGFKGGGQAGGVTISATDTLAISGDSKTGIFSESQANITRAQLGIANFDQDRRNRVIKVRGYLGSHGEGGGGLIRIDAARVNVDGGSISGMTSLGKAGDVTINAGRVTFVGGGQISTGTTREYPIRGAGYAGSVTLTATDTIIFSGASKMDDAGLHRSGRLSGRSGIISSTSGGAKAGKVQVTAPVVVLSDGAGIASESLLGSPWGENPQGPGLAGAVEVKANRLSIVSGAAIRTDTESAEKAGTVTINADWVEVSKGGGSGTAAGRISSSTLGWGNAGEVTVQADHLVVYDGGQVTTATSAGGNAGQVMITSRDPGVRSGVVDIRSGGLITSTTTGFGTAGTVTVEADQVVVTGNGGLSFTGITSDAAPRHPASKAKAGDVSVTARSVEVSQAGGRISSQTSGAGKAGQVAVHADSLSVQGGGAVTSETSGLGNAGSVAVTGQQPGVLDSAVSIQNGGIITSRTTGSGTGGTVTVEAGRVVVTGNGPQQITGITSDAAPRDPASKAEAGGVSVAAHSVEVSQAGGRISSQTSGAGKGGTVQVSGGEVVLADAAAITTASQGQGDAGAVTVHASGTLRLTGGAQIASSASLANAGPVTVTATDSLQMTGAAITTEATKGGGGQIQLTVGRLIDLADSQVTSSVVGQASTTNAGNITIDPRFLVLDRSLIKANAVGGNGGNLTITAGYLIRSPDSRIEASSQLGINGQINIQAPNPDLGASLTELPIAFLDASALLPTACAERFGTELSSLASRGLAALPPDPDRPWVMPYLGRGSATPARVAGEAVRQPPSASGSVAASLSFQCGR